MASAKQKVIRAEMAEGPHNGHPDYRVPNPDTGEPQGGQMALIDGMLRFEVFVAAVGRRFGKTTGLRYLWPIEASITPGVYRVGFIAPDHTKAHSMFTETMDAYGGDPRVVGKGKSIVVHAEGDAKSQRRFFRTGPIALEDQSPEERVNEGMEVWFFSGAHPQYEKIRGFTFHFNRFNLDEAVQLHPKLLAVINPMLAEAEAKCGIPGKLGITTTPDYDQIGNAWVESYFRNGEDDTMPEFGCMNFPMYAAPETILTRRAIEQEKSKALAVSEDIWRQEGLAEFLSGRGAVFSRLDDVFVLEPGPTPDWYRDIWGKVYDRPGSLGGERVQVWVHSDPRPGVRYVMGLDWARMRDATVMSIFDLERMEQACLLYMRNEDWEEQAEWASELHRHYNKATMYSDQHGIGDAQTRTLQRRFGEFCIGVKDWSSPSRKGGCVRDTQMLFNHAEIKMLNVEPQRGEFKSYMAEKNEKTGRVRYSHPPEGHDDGVDAVLMIADALRSGKRARVEERAPGPKWLSLDWIKRERKRNRSRARRNVGRI